MLATRARGAALNSGALRMGQGHRTGKRPLTFSARPCCDVSAAASNTKPAFAWSARERATALAIYQEKAQRAHLRRARAVPR